MNGPALFLLLSVVSPGCSLLSLNGLTGGDDGGDSFPPPTPYVTAVLADGPTAYWRLDETSGTVARDRSGHGNDATYVGGVALRAPGAIVGDPDGAAAFNGSNGYLDCGDRFQFGSKQAFSIEAWVKPASIGAYAGVASREDTSGGPPSEGYLLFVSPSDGVFGFQRLDGGNLTSATSTLTASATSYTHVVATYDGGQMTLYVNGVSQAVAPSTFGIAGAAHHFVVGAESGGGLAFFKGDIDDVALYEHALSAARVAEHHKVGIGLPP